MLVRVKPEFVNCEMGEVMEVVSSVAGTTSAVAAGGFAHPASKAIKKRREINLVCILFVLSPQR
jgi:hypothetical protein